MSTERALIVSEHLIADLERTDAAADRLDHSRKLSSQDRRVWPDKPGEESHEEGLGRPVGAVRPVHRRRVNLDEQLVVPGSRLLHFGDQDHFGRAVPPLDRCLHGRSLTGSGLADRHGDLRMPLEVAADLVGDLVDLPLGLLQSGLGLRGPRGSAALSPGRLVACSLCPSRSLEPAHDPVAPSVPRCGDMPDTRPRPAYAQTHEGRAQSKR
jgi:hypothetical protein